MEPYLDPVVIDRSASLVEALEAIDRSGVSSVVMVERSRRLIGILGGSEVRRALLSRRSLDEPTESFVKRDRGVVGPDVPRAEALDLMHGRALEQVPVVDEGGHLLGVHTPSEMFGSAERENWTVIVAGGRGSRLRPLTDDIPKPMVPIAGRPVLERLVLHLVCFGIQGEGGGGPEAHRRVVAKRSRSAQRLLNRREYATRPSGRGRSLDQTRFAGRRGAPWAGVAWKGGKIWLR